MPDRPWKAVERRLAKRLHGERLGSTGRSGPDILAGWLSIECKTRRTLPKWLRLALEQARMGAGDDRLPIAILHEVGSRHNDDLVLLSLRDFTLWFGPIEPKQCDGGEL